MNTTTTFRPFGPHRLASGSWVWVDEDGRATRISEDEAREPDEGLGHCSICDGVGHGYPGGGPCPLEERGFDDARRDEEMA